MMKLAFCLYKYFPFGGLQRDFIRIAKECLRRGHAVDVYTSEWQGENELGLNIHLLKSNSWQNHTRMTDFINQFHAILKNKHPYDCVVGFNKMPGLDFYYAADGCFIQKLNSKSFSHVRSILPHYRHLLANEKAVFAQDKTTQILLIAQNQQAIFQNYYHTPNDRFHYLPPGIGMDRIAPPNALEIRNLKRRELNLHENNILLLMVGSGFKTKGVDRAIMAVANLPKEILNRTKLFIIGQDHAEPFFRAIKKHHLSTHIQFLGGRHDVPEFLLAADLLLHPAYHENTGTVLLEAMVAGLPVITTDICGYAHYIEESNSGVVLKSPFNQNKFNEVLKDSITHLKLRNWRENAIEYSHKADIYNLPTHAVNAIEKVRVKCIYT